MKTEMPVCAYSSSCITRQWLLLWLVVQRRWWNNKTVPGAGVDCGERKTCWRIQIYEQSYSLRCISLWLIISSSFCEGCWSATCFQVHFRQVVLCSVLGGLQSFFWDWTFFVVGSAVESGWWHTILGIMWSCHLVALSCSVGFRHMVKNTKEKKSRKNPSFLPKWGGKVA